MVSLQTHTTSYTHVMGQLCGLVSFSEELPPHHLVHIVSSAAKVRQSLERWTHLAGEKPSRAITSVTSLDSRKQARMCKIQNKRT